MLTKDYANYMVRSNIASGGSINSIRMVLDKAIIGGETFHDFYIHLSLITEQVPILLGWDFISSHSNLFHSRDGGKLMEFDKDLYYSLDIHNNSIRGDIFYSNLMS